MKISNTPRRFPSVSPRFNTPRHGKQTELDQVSFSETQSGDSPTQTSLWKSVAVKAAQFGTAGVGTVAGMTATVAMGLGAASLGGAAAGLAGVLGLGALAVGTYHAVASKEAQPTIVFGALAAGAGSALASGVGANLGPLTVLLQGASVAGALSAVAGGIQMTAQWAAAGWDIARFHLEGGADGKASFR